MSQSLFAPLIYHMPLSRPPFFSQPNTRLAGFTYHTATQGAQHSRRIICEMLPCACLCRDFSHVSRLTLSNTISGYSGAGTTGTRSCPHIFRTDSNRGPSNGTADFFTMETQDSSQTAFLLFLSSFLAMRYWFWLFNIQRQPIYNFRDNGDWTTRKVAFHIVRTGINIKLWFREDSETHW